jgi:hypothetical protein
VRSHSTEAKLSGGENHTAAHVHCHTGARAGKPPRCRAPSNSQIWNEGQLEEEGENGDAKRRRWGRRKELVPRGAAPSSLVARQPEQCKVIRPGGADAVDQARSWEDLDPGCGLEWERRRGHDPSSRRSRPHQQCRPGMVREGDAPAYARCRVVSSPLPEQERRRRRREPSLQAQIWLEDRDGGGVGGPRRVWCPAARRSPPWMSLSLTRVDSAPAHSAPRRLPP